MARRAGSHLQAPDGNNGLRRSPRKKGPAIERQGDFSTASSTSKTTGRPELSSASRSPTAMEVPMQRTSSILQEISLPSTEDEHEFETAISSAQRARPSSRPADLDSIIMPFSKVSLSRDDDLPSHAKFSKSSRTKSKASTHYTSRYVLKEADCVDDYSDENEDEDEATDLSGFIVDDDAEISFHVSSNEEQSEDETPEKRRPQKQTRRRLQRGHRRIVDSDESDKENDIEDRSAAAPGSPAFHSKVTEVIDLTSSPAASSQNDVSKLQEPASDPFSATDTTLTKSLKGLSLFDPMMRLSPPRKEPFGTSTAETREQSPVSEVDSSSQERPQTPTWPQTPPHLESPSKLLSPSKRTKAQRSPHRQSTDAFWDHNTVNDWNDSYSPKKAPVVSPAKINPSSRFAIWSDSPSSPSSEVESSHSVRSTSPLPSPCASPTKPRTMSPIKAARAAAVAEKKATAARKAAFNADKHALAANLLSYLDEHVTSSQLSTLSASTGGVQVTWSKTLRSTAGRANWRRSVTRPQTGSPIKGSPVKGLVRGEKVKVEHFANIELAEKVIDNEERLVNTLAHEFCHLANFMVSGVRDQPHGASFKRWADEATACLARAGIGQNGRDDRVRESWGKCKVTTKHSYEIEWKYLWCCVGREQSDAMKFLNVEGGKGCGAEYGRHSKSIDTERMRCGRCKGKLVQVRPTPRTTAKKNNNGGKGGEKEGKAKKGSVGRNSSESESSRSSTGTEGLVTKLKEIEVVELSN